MHGLPVLIWLPVRMGTECTADAGGVSDSSSDRVEGEIIDGMKRLFTVHSTRQREGRHAAPGPVQELLWDEVTLAALGNTCKGRCGSMLATTIMLEMREY